MTLPISDDWKARLKPRVDPPGQPLHRPEPRVKKPAEPLRGKRSTKRLAKREAENFGAQGEAARRKGVCCACAKRKPTVAAHVRSRGAGGKSRDICALCWECHTYAHDHGNAALEAKYDIDLAYEAELLAREVERKRGHDCEKWALLRENPRTEESRYVCGKCGGTIPDEQDA